MSDISRALNICTAPIARACVLTIVSVQSSFKVINNMSCLFIGKPCWISRIQIILEYTSDNPVNNGTAVVIGPVKPVQTVLGSCSKSCKTVQYNAVELGARARQLLGGIRCARAEHVVPHSFMFARPDFWGNVAGTGARDESHIDVLCSVI